MSAEERALRFGHPAALVWAEGDRQCAQLIERRLFEDGWFVHLMNASDYETQDLIPVVRAFHSAGIVVVLLTDASTANREQLRELVGPSAFFEAGPSADQAADVANELMERLTIWRENAMLKAKGA